MSGYMYLDKQEEKRKRGDGSSDTSADAAVFPGVIHGCTCLTCESLLAIKSVILFI